VSGLAHAILSFARGLERLIAPYSELEGLRVTVFGLRDHISRDTVHYLVRKRAIVTVAGQACEVELLRRDLELLNTQVSLAPLDIIDEAEVRLVTDSLRALGKLPHVIVCCCAGGDCPIPIVGPVMQPSLVLHLAANGLMEPRRGRPALAARTLAALLNDSGLFDPARALAKVRLGLRLFDVSRRDAVPDGRTLRHQLGAADRPPPPSKSAHRPAAPTRRAFRSRHTPPLHQGDQL